MNTLKALFAAIKNTVFENALYNTVIFTRELAALSKSGIPLVRALTICGDQALSLRMKNVVERIIVNIRQGKLLSQSFPEDSPYFSPFYIGMLKIGEATGTLSEVLTYLVTYLEEQLLLHRKVISSLIYPAFTLIICLGVTVLANFFALPPILEQLKNMQIEMPLPTKLLVAGTGIVHNFWFQIFFVIFFIFIMWQTRKFLINRQVRFWLDKIKFNLPLVGQLIKLLTLISFTTKLELLLKTGYSLNRGMGIIIESEKNNLYFGEAICSRLINEIIQGDTISTAAYKVGFFPPIFTQLLNAGEESGEVPFMLSRIRKEFVEDFNRILASALSVIEPVVIGFMGGLVAFVLIAIFMPLYQFIGKI